MSSKAFLYALLYELYKENRIRRYGFHGTSHKYVAAETAKLLGKKKEECNIITVHLGNGSSLAAVKEGKCVDTSMSMTSLIGVDMVIPPGGQGCAEATTRTRSHHRGVRERGAGAGPRACPRWDRAAGGARGRTETRAATAGGAADATMPV